MDRLNLFFYSVPHLSYGRGFERWLTEVTKRLKKEFNIYIITTRLEKRFNVNLEDINYIEVRNLYAIPLSNLSNYFRYADLLYFNNAFVPNNMIIYSLKKLLGLKVIAGYHSAFPNVGNIFRRAYHNIVSKKIDKFYDAHHVVNEDRKKLLLSWGFRNVYKIPNGIDSQKFKPDFELKFSQSKFIVLFVGALTYQKGIDILLRIYLEHFRNNKEVEFWIAGAGPLQRIVQKISKKYRNFVYFGRVDDKILIKLYQTAHLLIAPSRSGYEEFLLTPLEAMSCGTPIIVSDIPGPREYVDSKVGFLVDLNSLSITDKIYFLYKLWKEDLNSYKQLCKNARSKAEQFNWGIIVKKLKKLILKIYYNEI